MKKLILFSVLGMFLLILISAADFTPQGNINLRDTYNITGAPYINGSTVYSGGFNLTTGYLFSTNGSYLLITNWNATNSSYLEISNWNATNSSYLEIVNWNSTNTSYALLTELNNGTYVIDSVLNNGTYTAGGSDATWLANWTAYNDTWSSITNTSYLLVINWNSTNQTYADNNDSMKNYVDAQDLIFNNSIVNWITSTYYTITQSDALNTSQTNYINSNNVSVTNAIATKLANLVEDTTPQLGGYLDTNTNNIGATDDEIENIYVATDSVIFFGNGQEASITYNGTALVISG